MEEFSKEVEDVGRVLTTVRGLDVKFWEARRSWRLSQGRSSPERFADEK